jgi:hypothetical protein
VVEAVPIEVERGNLKGGLYVRLSKKSGGEVVSGGADGV